LREQIRQSVAVATKKAYLRPNAVDSLSGKNSGDNLGGEAFPTIHFEEIESDDLTVELILKGGGCENVGAQVSLPDDRLNAGRDLEGVRRVVLEAVHRAQGQGCAPGILGVAIGGDRGSSFAASKEVLLRPLDDVHPQAELAELEARLLQEGNQLGIGPMGFGGETTLLGVKATDLHRLPASFFVSVSYMCWAYRRRRMVVDGDDVSFS
jgi:fumarate hydratase class I